ncbi:competence protein CoiA family protein [Kitasatospora sp. NPDC088783]|uniref:competence protein CoiA family protein n=1 Tax=Kitasatospora sp. NPDC088783 TaxID=3364077 RepID=UPI003810327E
MFTALHPDAGRLDATLPDLGCGLAWESVHKVRPRIALTCPDCGHGVHARRSSRKLAHFAHDSRRPEHCELAEESMEHHLTKLELAVAIRASGWHAELEVGAPDGSWRADVMACAPDGSRRIAWEAQLSPITVEDIRARTDRYARDGIEVCWVTSRKAAAWMGRVPSVRVDPADGRWRVDDGVAGFDPRAGRWQTVPSPLADVVRWVHTGGLTVHQVLPRYRRVRRAADEDFAKRPLVWASRTSRHAEAKHETMRQRQDELKQARLEREAKLEQQRKEEEVQAAARQREREEHHRQARREHQELQWDLSALISRGRRALERRRAEHDAEQRRLQEQEEERRREEQQAADLAAGRAWWSEVSAAQRAELAAAVEQEAWTTLTTRAQIDPDALSPQYAYGVAAWAGGSRYGLFGVIRPCPSLVGRCPELLRERVFVRNAREARLLFEAGLDPACITHFGLPDFEQTTLC